MAKKHKTLVYFREFGEIEGYDCSELTLQNRLFLSAILTKHRFGLDETLGQIIFSYDEFHSCLYSKTNIDDFDKLITEMIQKKYGKLFDFIVENATVRNGKNWKIHAIEIDKNKMFTLRNGSNNQKQDSRLASLSWRAFALAAAASESLVTEWRTLPIYAYNFDLEAINGGNIPTTSKTQIKNSITKWLETVNIGGEFKGDCFVVDSAKFINKTGQLIRGGVKHKQQEKQTRVVEDKAKEQEQTKRIEEAVKKAPNGTKVFEVIKNETKNEQKQEQRQEEREEWMLAVDRKSKNDELMEWQKYYDETKEKVMNEEKWQSILGWIYVNWGSVGDAITKIGKNHRVSKDVLDKAMRDEYLSDKEGGLAMKNALRKDLLDLRQHILNSEFDDSWCKDKVIRKINVAFAYKCWPALMMME